MGYVGRMIVPAVFPPPLGDHFSNRLNRLPPIVLPNGTASGGGTWILAAVCHRVTMSLLPGRHGYDLMLTLPVAVSGGNPARDAPSAAARAPS